MDHPSVYHFSELLKIVLDFLLCQSFRNPNDIKLPKLFIQELFSGLFFCIRPFQLNFFVKNFVVFNLHHLVDNVDICESDECKASKLFGPLIFDQSGFDYLSKLAEII